MAGPDDLRTLVADGTRSREFTELRNHEAHVTDAEPYTPQELAGVNPQTRLRLLLDDMNHVDDLQEPIGPERPW